MKVVKFLLLLLALIAGLVATCKGFGWLDMKPDEYDGWFAASLTLLVASLLVPGGMWAPGRGT